ncbi:hypothetical protein [Streptomyces sp. NPDC059928]|uniref:hypothetical protein n=1 Tax=unclassified Streptomyces TaxID=2593676 RepID=UPI0036483819
MTRREPSPADLELIERLAALGITVSAAQLERWRGAGLLPAHARRWPGRGRGSVSVLAEETVATAAALARHARPGRDLRWTVIAWYAEAGYPVLPGELAVPEPPWPAVHQALVWAMGRSRTQRLIETARASAGTGEASRMPSTKRQRGCWGRGLADRRTRTRCGGYSKTQMPNCSAARRPGGGAVRYVWPRPLPWAPKRSAARPSSRRSPP